MKILVIYATAGAGHRKAAEAIAKELKASGQHETVLVDLLEYTSWLYRNSYNQTYTFFVSKIPWLWGFFFQLLDIPFLQPLIAVIRRGLNAINARPLERYLQNENFDYIFSTHFTANEVAAALKRKGKIRSVIVCSITDFDAHRIWLCRGIDYYTVATPWTREKLLKLGVPADRVLVTGIPTDTKFSASRDIRDLKQKLGLQEGIFTVLVATGSFGIGPIETILETLEEFQVLVVCGHNQSLCQRLSQRHKPLAKIFGLVNNMDELMAVADVIVTKPGGLSISESLVCGLPLIFFNAIPGQETNNIKVLQTYGVGISGCSIPEMAQRLKRFRVSPQELQTAKDRSRSLGKPAAVKEIVALTSKQ